jgi:acetyl esterase/lipase
VLLRSRRHRPRRRPVRRAPEAADLPVGRSATTSRLRTARSTPRAGRDRPAEQELGRFEEGVCGGAGGAARDSPGTGIPVDAKSPVHDFLEAADLPVGRSASISRPRAARSTPRAPHAARDRPAEQELGRFEEGVCGGAGCAARDSPGTGIPVDAKSPVHDFLEAADLPVGRSASISRPRAARSTPRAGLNRPAEQELGRFEEGVRGGAGGAARDSPGTGIPVDAKSPVHDFLEAADLPVGRSASISRPRAARSTPRAGLNRPAEQELGRFEEGVRGGAGGAARDSPGTGIPVDAKSPVHDFLEAADLPVGRSASISRPRAARSTPRAPHAARDRPAEQELGRFEEGGPATPRGAARGVPALLFLLAALVLAGCAPALRVSLRPFYEPAPLAYGVRVERDVAYAAAAAGGAGGTAHAKQRLDLYRPRGEGWPTIVFVHGGSFENGDKDLEIGGLDIYANIGRFYSARGFGVAVIAYRLQPEVDWLDQVDDVAAALAWTVRHVPERGGSGRVYLAGHSAGAWLAARVALDERVLARHGLGPGDVAGVISISGSGFDLTDRLTWEMYPREDWWAQRFERDGAERPWQEEASLVPLVGPGAPSFLLLHAERELAALQRQNRLFHEALQRAGVASRLHPVRDGSHRRIVLAMSRGDREVTEQIVSFVRAAD